MKNKKLSVVIPTLNREIYLRETLELLIPQIENKTEYVELIICINSSKDNTLELVKGLKLKYPFLQYFYFEEYLEIVQSITRAIKKASGRFILIFGDDDIPYPYYIDNILQIINENTDIGIICSNKLVGNDTKDHSIRNLHLHNSIISMSLTKRMSLSDFIAKHALEPGFISSAVFLRDAWEKGIKFYSEKHYGYNFLNVFYHGIEKSECIYIDFPCVVQRQPFERDWLKNFPLFRLIGIPNLMKDLEESGLCSNAFSIWEKNYNKSLFQFCYILFVASAYKKKYRKLCKVINNHQKNIIRKLLTYFFIMLLPSPIYNFTRKYILYRE